MGKRMDDWLRNMGDWNISRRRYYGLPLPFYPCECGHLNVIGSKAELRGACARRPRPAGGAAPAVDRRGADPCEQCGEPRCAASPRSATSGSTPASSPSRRSAGRTRSSSPQGYATGAAKGLTRADLPDHAYWEQWFPADWVSEMREQIRLWFYSQHFMSVVLTGRAPFRQVLGYEKMLDETRPRDAQLVGEHDRGRGRVRAHGRRRDALAVLRAAARPEPPLRLRARRTRSSASCSRSGTRSSSSSTTRTSRASGRRGPTCPSAASCGRSTAGSSPARTQLVARGDGGATRPSSPSTSIRAFEAFVDDLSNWYIRRSRRRFWDGDRVALHALVRARPVAARGRAGDAVPRRAPVAEPRARASAGSRRRRSISPAGRTRREPDEPLLAEMAEVRRVVGLGHQARAASRPEAAPAAAPARRRGRAARRRRTRTRCATSCA